MLPIKIAVVGVGKIARDQHLPVLASHESFALRAIASPIRQKECVTSYPDIEALLNWEPGIDAIAICTPPQERYAIARHAILRGVHVFLEKPPAATIGEIQALVALASLRHVALFAAWHSREASGVAPARRWLATRRVRRVHVEWREDVRVWHPGQSWIWRAGGLGVFDPGINALSILTSILPGALMLCDAELSVPSNCQTPIEARLSLRDEHNCEISVDLSFLEKGEHRWNIDVDCDDGHLELSDGGAVLSIDGRVVVSARDREYAGLYTHFAKLVHERGIDVDVTPLTLVADAYLAGRRIHVAPFIE